MTPKDHILGRLSKGPHTAAQLACTLHVDAGIPLDQMYIVFFREAKELIKEGKVEWNENLLIYRLSTSQISDEPSKDD